eukprot:Opistho-2@25235
MAHGQIPAVLPFGQDFRIPADFPDHTHDWAGMPGLKPAITLVNEHLWQQFNQHTNEMIIAKKGRCLFPVPRLLIANLEPEVLYTVAVDFVPVDSVRWKYVDGRWMEGGKGEKHVLASVHVHPDSPHSGAFWMKKEIAFDAVKVTNKFNNDGHIVLNTFHKYRLRFHIIKINEPLQEPTIIKTESFPATDFIAVTSYVNEQIKFLKINNNPFARAFKMDKEPGALGQHASANDHSDSNEDNDESEGDQTRQPGSGQPTHGAPVPPGAGVQPSANTHAHAHGHPMQGPSAVATVTAGTKRKAAAMASSGSAQEIDEAQAVTAAAAVPDARDQLPSAVIDRPLKVLVVDGDTAVHDLVNSHLQGKGYVITCVTNTTRAWDLLKDSYEGTVGLAASGAAAPGNGRETTTDTQKEGGATESSAVGVPLVSVRGEEGPSGPGEPSTAPALPADGDSVDGMHSAGAISSDVVMAGSNDANVDNTQNTNSNVSTDAADVDALGARKSPEKEGMSGPFDIVLTEIAGDDLDGLALMRRIRTTPQLLCTAVTLMSVEGHPAAADTCVSEGADDYMTKPLCIGLFGRRGKTCVEKRRWKARERWITTALRDETKCFAELERVHEMLGIQKDTKTRKVDELEEEVSRLRGRITAATR